MRTRARGVPDHHNSRLQVFNYDIIMNTEASNDLLRTGSAYSIAQKRPSQSSSALPLKRLASSSSCRDDRSILRHRRGMSNPHPCSSLSAITPTPTKKQRVVSADDDNTTKTTYDDVNVGADAAAIEAATALAAIGMPRRPGHMAHVNSQSKAKSTSFQQKENLENNRWQQCTTRAVNNHPGKFLPCSSHHQHYLQHAGNKHTVSNVTNSYSGLRKEQPIETTSEIFVVPPSSFKKAHQRDSIAINSFACAPYSSARVMGYNNIPRGTPFSSSGGMSNKTNPQDDAHPVRMLPPPPRQSPFAFPPGSYENTMSVPITPQHQDQQQEQFRGNGIYPVSRRAPRGSGSVRVQGASMSRYQVPCSTFNHSTAGAGDGTSVGHGRFTHGQAPKAKPPQAMIANDHSTRVATPAERRDDHAAVGTADESAAVVRMIRREGSLCSGGGAIIRSHGDGPPAPSLSRSSSSESRLSQIRWFPGHTSLALSGDDDVLSPLHCFMRRHCVEAFSATADDVCQPRYGKSHGNRVSIGQVGIRCLHCRYRQAHERADRAVCYPSTIKNIYHSMETWQRRHSALCRDIPQWVREKMRDLVAASRSGAGGRRQYWVDAALRLGLVDTPEGVRFGRDPSSDEFRRLRHDDDGAPAMPAACEEDSSSCIREEVTSSGPAPATVATTNTESSRRIVSPHDKDLVNEHLYLLMEQMEPCRFSEADRTGGRSKVKDLYVGYPGLQCRHCQGKAGFGRYFPSSISNLTLANSDRNIHNHMMKCRKCPAEIKSSLNNLQRMHAEEGGKSKRGSRKIFFTRIWTKLHPVDDGTAHFLTLHQAK